MAEFKAFCTSCGSRLDLKLVGVSKASAEYVVSCPSGCVLSDQRIPAGVIKEGQMEFCDFGWALDQLRAGKKVARIGWNGKGMWLVLVPGSTITVTEGRPLAAIFPAGSVVEYQPHIDMRTANGTVVPWLASQTDVLATDWTIVD